MSSSTRVLQKKLLQLDKNVILMLLLIFKNPMHSCVKVFKTILIYIFHF